MGYLMNVDMRRIYMHKNSGLPSIAIFLLPALRTVL